MGNMKKFFNENRVFTADFLLWVFLFTFSIALFVDDAMRNRRLPTHPYVAATQKEQRALREGRTKSGSRLFVYFIDALRFDYAIDPHKMPTVASLLKRGVWGKVNPCLTNMTVHCVEATFSGRDRSSILSFSDDFHPRASKNKSSWMFQMAARGHKITAVSDYVIDTLYGDLLYKKLVYKKGRSQKELTELALKWFDDPHVSVSIVHLLGPHDDGQTYGTTGPEYNRQLKIVDTILASVVERLKPTDTLLVYGDHGINDLGQHTYNTDTPTLYLYVGPKVVPGKRFDMDIASHTFFLNVLFELPFDDNYQGETYWGAFTEEARRPYGTSPEVFCLKRLHKRASVQLRPTQLVLLGVLFVLILLGALFRVDGMRSARWWMWVMGFVVLVLLTVLNTFWLLPLVFLFPSLLFLRRGPTKGALLFAGGLLLFGIVRALAYSPLDLLIHDSKISLIYLFYLLEVLVAMAVAHLLNKTASPGEKLGLAATLLGLFLLVFHYPTLYFYGVIRGVPFVSMLLLSGYALSRWLSKAAPFRAKEQWFLLPLLLLALGFMGTQISMFVENFRIFSFKYVPTGRSLLAHLWALTPYIAGTGILVAQLPKKGAHLWATLGAALVGLLFTFDLGLPPRFYLLLFVLVLFVALFPFYTLFGIPKRVVLWLLMVPELAYMNQFELGPFYQITGIALFAGVVNLFVPPGQKGARLKLAVPYILLALLALVVAYGFRTNGIDYKFAIKWFPKLFEKLWVVIFFADVVKYFMGIVLLSLFFPRGSQKTFCLAGNLLVTLQLSLGTFLLFLFLVEKSIPLVVDSMEETVYMMGLLLFTGVLALLYPRLNPPPHKEKPQ